MAFNDVLAERFPDSLTATAYASRTHSVLYQLGFQRSMAITCVALCRDEITQPFRRTLDNLWGDGFDASALAGVPTLGRVGLGAAVAHSPLSGGRARIVCYGLTHVAIDRDGVMGACERHGRPSSACGALEAVQRSIEDGGYGTELDAAEPEFSHLRQCLAPRLPEDRVPDLVELTMITHDAIAERLSSDLAAVIDTSKADFAVATGVLIHGPGRREFVWPGALFAVVAGERKRLSLGMV